MAIDEIDENSLSELRAIPGLFTTVETLLASV